MTRIGMTVYASTYPVLIFAFLLGSAAMYVHWRLNPNEAGIKLWFWGISGGALGCTMAVSGIYLANESLVPSFMAAALRTGGSWVNCLAWLLVACGFRRFMAKAMPSRTLMIVVALILFIIMHASIPFNLPPSWEIGWTGLVLCLGSVLMISLLLQGESHGLASWFSIAGLLLILLAWGSRLVWTLISPFEPQHGNFGYLIMLCTIAATIAINMGMAP